MLIINIIIPAMRFIHLLFLVRKCTNFFPAVPLIKDIKKRGIPIPIPNRIKFRRFVRKAVVDVLIANSTVIDAGLQGIIIKEKNAPNNNELR